MQQLTLNMGRPEGLLAFSTDTTIVLEDGVQELPVVQVHDRFALDGGTLAGLALGLGQAVTEDGTVLYAGGAALGGFPPMWQTMIAVDPVAEEELLGGSGVFLDPLVTAGALGDRTRAGLHPEWGEIIREETIGGPGMPEDTIVPIVVNTDPQFRLEATVVGREVDVSRIQPLWVQGQLDRPEPSEVFQREIWTAPNTVELGTTSAVFGEEFVPFTLRPTAVEPDWLPPADQPGFQSVGYSLVERTVPREVGFTDRAVPGVDCAMEVMPVGAPHRESWLLPSQDPNAEFTRGQSGYSVQDYRDDTDVGGMNGLNMYVIGEYSSSSVDVGVDAASYVPLGAYEVGETFVLGDDPTTDPTDAAELRPALNARGITAASAGAITDLEGGRALVGRDAIDAVRVRVAGLTGYDAQGRAAVHAVAAELATMGFDVQVVAGSSREATLIYVPGYFVDERSPRQGDLGWVTQEWSTLGAADQVQTSLDQAGRSLLLLSLGMSCVLTLVVLAVAGRARRAEVTVLGELGWTRRDVRRWLAAELAVGGAVLTGVVTAGVLWARWRDADAPLLGGSALLVLGVYAVGCLGLLRLATTLPRPGRMRPALQRSSGALSVVGIVRRGLSTGRWAAVTLAFGLAAIGTGVGAVALAVATARREAGDSRLGELLTSSLLPWHLGLASVGLVGALALTYAAARDVLGARGRTVTALITSGWAPSETTRLWHVEVALLTSVALLLGPLLTWAVALPTGIAATLPVLVTAGSTLLAGVALAAATPSGHRA